MAAEPFKFDNSEPSVIEGSDLETLFRQSGGRKAKKKEKKEEKK